MIASIPSERRVARLLCPAARGRRPPRAARDSAFRVAARPVRGAAERGQRDGTPGRFAVALQGDAPPPPCAPRCRDRRRHRRGSPAAWRRRRRRCGRPRAGTRPSSAASAAAAQRSTPCSSPESKQIQARARHSSGSALDEVGRQRVEPACAPSRCGRAAGRRSSRARRARRLRGAARLQGVVDGGARIACPRRATRRRARGARARAAAAPRPPAARRSTAWNRW